MSGNILITVGDTGRLLLSYEREAKKLTLRTGSGSARVAPKLKRTDDADFVIPAVLLEQGGA